MGDGITDYIEGNPNLTKEAFTDICSITLERLEITSAFVSPAVWLITGEAPDAVDVGLWGLGIAGGIVGMAGMATSALKAYVDDDIHKRVMAIRHVEGAPYSKYIKSTLKYSMLAGDGINATSIAAAGGTAWETRGLWVYVTDATGKLVCDYEPKIANTVYGPLLPLRPVSGGFSWRKRKG